MCGSSKHVAAAAVTVSIARRLQDPLAELIKIDPKNIGVGMYQVCQLIGCFLVSLFLVSLLSLLLFCLLSLYYWNCVLHLIRN